MGSKVQMRFHKRKSPWKKIIIIVGVIIGLGIIIFMSSNLVTIEVKDTEHYTKEELQQYFVKNIFESNTFILYYKLTYGEPIDIPFVQKYDVQFVDRHTIAIDVYEKPIVGCIGYMNEYVYFDKDGKVLEVSEEKLEGVPLITGVHISEMKLYDKLVVDNNQVFKKIMALSQLINRYKLSIDKVTFDSSLNVTLVAKDVRVLLGNRKTYDEPISELTQMLPKLKNRKGELDMIDFELGQKQTIFREDK